MIKILIVDDEKPICDLIDLNRSAAGYFCKSVQDGMKAIECIEREKIDLILLDIMLPDIDGLEVCRQIREFSYCSILFLSSKNDDVDKILGLACGGDDYITKPFGNSELLARIRTALRHVNRLKTDTGQTNHPYRSHGLIIDFQKRLITRDGAEIHLTQNEFKIVSLLAQNCGQVLTYDRLIVHVWGPYSENDTTSLRVHMANIRRKLEPNPSEPMYIFTEIGVGYRMVDEDET